MVTYTCKGFPLRPTR